MNGAIAVVIRRAVRRLVKGRSPASAAEVERAEQTFYIEYLRDGMTAFDVGANVGEIALLFSRFVGTRGQVHAFEASSAVYARLAAMCDITGRTNIAANHLAVSDTVGTVKLYLYDGSFSGWNSLADRPLSDYGIDVKPSGTEDVPATTIDAYCREHGIDTIDLLKIDVEGAEYQVLLGARQMLEARKIRCIVFEFGQTTFDMGNDPASIRKYLNRMGYGLRNVVKGDPIFPGGASVETARFSVHVATPSS